LRRRKTVSVCCLYHFLLFSVQLVVWRCAFLFFCVVLWALSPVGRHLPLAAVSPRVFRCAARSEGKLGVGLGARRDAVSAPIVT